MANKMQKKGSGYKVVFFTHFMGKYRGCVFLSEGCGSFLSSGYRALPCFPIVRFPTHQSRIPGCKGIAASGPLPIPHPLIEGNWNCLVAHCAQKPNVSFHSEDTAMTIGACPSCIAVCLIGFVCVIILFVFFIANAFVLSLSLSRTRQHNASVVHTARR